MSIRPKLISFNRLLSRLSNAQILAISSFGVLIIASLDFLTGYEVSVSVLYLVPVAVASWYAGRRASILIAVFSCSGWFAADIATGHPYSYMIIPVWNALVRLGFFLANGLLLVELHDSLFHQRELARTDALTGVFGRRAFEERLEHDLDLARRKRIPLTVAFIDLDNFKALNDVHGHRVGDRALRATAQVLQVATRREDTVSRLGGDEFAVIFPDTGHQGAKEVVEKLMNNLRYAFRSVSPDLTCSIGVITFDGIAPQLAETVHAADSLMYQAKNAGKNRVTFKVITDGVDTTVSNPV
ncbi:MAG TPA: diguanylate cyclase [Gallionella sp.]|nr:diguanylate cyclase [Gallionella sp.]